MHHRQKIATGVELWKRVPSRQPLVPPARRVCLLMLTFERASVFLTSTFCHLEARQTQNLAENLSKHSLRATVKPPFDPTHVPSDSCTRRVKPRPKPRA